MNKTEIITKVKKISGIIAAVALVLFIICMISLSSACNSIADYVGSKPSISELGESIEKVEDMVKMFGGTMEDVAEMIGISVATLNFVRFSLAMRIPFLVIAIIAAVLFGAIVILENNPDIASKILGAASQGAGKVGNVVKNTYDKATVKCDKCGKTFVAGKKFCPNCGNKIDDSIECPQCGTFSKPGTKFCPNCGKNLE